MEIEEIIKYITEMEDYSVLVSIAAVLQKRVDHLTQESLKRIKQKFKKGQPIRIKDEKGEYHKGMFYGIYRKKVRFYINNKEIKLNPLQFESYGAEVIE